MVKKPKLSFWQIWNISFGFLGVQFGFQLQNSNTSRIFQTMGAEVDELPLFFLLAPLMGLIVQPLVGVASDKTWTRLGRRSPYILGGAIASMFAMFLLPNAPIITAIMSPLLFGAVMLALMDASFNVTFQPFRSLVADMLPEEQRNKGYSIQSFLINIGAVIGAALPFVLTSFGVGNEAPEGEVPPSVVWSFYLGGAVLILSVLITIFTTKEYPPKEMEKYSPSTESDKKESFFKTLVSMPKTMRQISVVQFFSWAPFFIMWSLAPAAVAQHYWNTPIEDNISAGFNEAATWITLMYGLAYLFAALFSAIMPRLVKATNRKVIYAFSMACGGLGFMSMFFFQNQYMLILSMLGIGISWAGMLAMPYAILSNSLPSKKMGTYMGIFNLTVVIPQIVIAIFSSIVVGLVFESQAIYMMLIAGISMVIGSISVYIIKDNHK